MLHICSYTFHPSEHINILSKTPVFFQDLELANFSFNTSRLWIVSFHKGVTLPVTDYADILRNNSISTFFQHHYNWLISPTTFVHIVWVVAFPDYQLVLDLWLWLVYKKKEEPLLKKMSRNVCMCVCLLNLHCCHCCVWFCFIFFPPFEFFYWSTW